MLVHQPMPLGQGCECKIRSCFASARAGQWGSRTKTWFEFKPRFPAASAPYERNTSSSSTRLATPEGVNRVSRARRRPRRSKAASSCGEENFERRISLGGRAAHVSKQDTLLRSGEGCTRLRRNARASAFVRSSHDDFTAALKIRAIDARGLQSAALPISSTKDQSTAASGGRSFLVATAELFCNALDMRYVWSLWGFVCPALFAALATASCAGNAFTNSQAIGGASEQGSAGASDHSRAGREAESTAGASSEGGVG